MFSLRIVNVDHYMSSPKSGLDLTYSQFRGAQVKSVPVFRIFGSTPSGNKTCLHVHGVFPYILVPYSGEDDAGRLMYQLASSLDKAINVSQNTSYSTRQHVFKIVQVSGRPFYGYHGQDHQFFKIFFYNPLIVKRACDLLQNGAVCGTKFQIHEGHVPFTLQFFIDYNLYGMSFINLKSVVYRKDASPPGITPGILTKESCCELEADAVAVDILNRLTIEGELAVNPGLAAIWREEKQRLKRDALEVSQRPEPPLAMSEVLLREKLSDNLRFQGKCKTPLKENIPYPVETQRTTGSDILNASVLDTHSVSTLASTRPSTAEETTIIDEELVLNLTQSSLLSSSLDQSLLAALDNLAAQNEVNAAMTQQVEDDSILGSQMVPEQDMFGNDVSDGELEALNYSLPPDLSSDNHSEDEKDEESDDNFEENIPQLDGVGDFGGKKKKSKQSKRKRRVLMENSATETYHPSDGEEILMNTIIKDDNCWPESGKQETLEEIFSDEEPYNSPINNFEDSCESLDLEPINVDLISSFETVLRGDPSFTSGDLVSEDVMFQPIDEGVEDSGEKKTSLIEQAIFNNTQYISDKNPSVDKNSNVDAVLSLNTSLDTTDMDKSVMLAISGEELLNTSQLDEILNEDLNKGLEIICEKSPQREFEENWIRPGDSSNPSGDVVSLSAEMLVTSDEMLHTGSIDGSEERIDEEIIEHVIIVGEEKFEPIQPLEIEEVDIKSDVIDIYLDENHLNIDDIEKEVLPSEEKEGLDITTGVNCISFNETHPQIDATEKKASPSEKKSPSQEGLKKKANSNTLKKSPLKKKSHSLSPQANNKLCVKLFNKTKIQSVCTYNDLSEMTRKEIETYFSQLETVTKYLSLRTDIEIPQPMLWSPIRRNLIIENVRQKGVRKRKPKTKAIETIMKKCKLSYDEILKMKSCKVKVHKLTASEISYLSGKPVSQLSTSNGIRTDPSRKNLKQVNLKTKSLQIASEQLKSLSSPVISTCEKCTSIKENNVKQNESFKTIDNAKKPYRSKKSPQRLSANVPLFQLNKTSPKPKNCDAKKSLCSKKSPLKSLDKVPVIKLPKLRSNSASDTISEFCNIQNITNTSLKKHKSSKMVQIDEIEQKKLKSVVKQLSFLDNENSISSKKKEKNGNSTKKVKENFKHHDFSSFGNKDKAPEKDQSTSFKLNTNCVIRLLPLPFDKASEKHTEEDSGMTKGLRIASSDNTCNKPLVFQERELDEMPIPKKLNGENNRNPLVRVEQLVTFCSSGDSVLTLEKDIKSDTESKKQRLSIKDEYKPLNIKSLEKIGSRKRPLRIYSLDGAVDSSSSDENIEDKKRSSKPPETGVHYSTPNKRRKSKSCRSPRNYVPLSIEVKRSPNVKPKNKTKDLVDPLVAERLSAIHRREGAAIDDFYDLSSPEKSDSSKCHVKRKLMDPLVSIKRLPSLPNLDSDASNSADRSQPIASTSSHSLVKKLKVFVKRLSLDTQGDQLEHARVAKLKGRSHRSSSLPVTSEEKTSCSKKVDNSKCHSKGELGVTGSEGDEGNLGFTDNCKKVRKTLVFPGKEKESRFDSGTLIPTPMVKSKPIPERKFSTDMFDANNTPEIPSALSNHSDNSSDFLRLSGVSKSNLSDFEGDTLISESPLNNTILSLNYSEYNSENMSIMNININPYDLQNPTLFTPPLFPPSRSEVLAKLREFGLPEVVSDEPFYSDPRDVSKACEVGSTVLKLQSKSVIHMEEFEGTFGSLAKLKKESLQTLCNEGYNSCFKQTRSNKTLIITPLKPPPTQLQAKEWLKSKLVKKSKEVAEIKKITKILIPSSPGNAADDDDDSMDDSMTISQCTSLSKASVEESDAVTVHSQSTPEVVVSQSSNTSPLMASTPVNNQLKTSASKRRFSRPSSGFRQSLPLIKEENQDNLQEGVNLHQHEINSQTASVSDSTKLLSDSGIKRLLSESKSPASMSCQIDMVTPNNSGNYRLELENLQDVKLVQEHQFLTILSMELHVHTRGELRPNPDHDAICCIFYNITNDYPDPSISTISGAICVSNDGKEEKMPQFKCELQAVADETSLIAAFLDLVRKWDPDIFVGYEIELLSWGYLLQRAYVLNMNLVAELSRVSRPSEGRAEGQVQEVGDDDSEIRLTGRIVLNLWRFLRHEVALQSYTFENIMYHVLHQRVPLFSFRTLTTWWAHRTRLYRWLVFEHYLTRVEGMAKLMRHVDLVGRTSEFARLFGIQFYDVLSRGSQFRVESMMLRLVKPLNYVAVSPSVQQRAKMRAPESLPLIMEPQSRFYTDPVIVLDFQSLYPSIIIAYNYCFSTCLGRVEHLGRSELFEFGCTQLRVPVRELLKLKGSLNYSPCGVTFVNQSVVRGVLPRMLEEILNTRLMVKQSMKENKGNKTLQRVLHNRQLGLKLIANVTYGYTAANFSGRMPCIEVGDSVVSKARETLERAISLVGNNKQWGARVVYGDTDSMFVLVPGKSREEAFRIGAEIAEAVTNDNPQPVKLKLEKVYQPCLLQTKKRYVGYMYESASQEEPVYDAKGIETVRRDGCPAVAKVLEKSLRLLFETKDVSLVKRYVCRQFSKVVSGRVSVQDLTFAREYRGAAGYRPGACVPALELAKQGRAVDPRSEPRVGERVPYVVVAGAPGLPLIRLVRPPSALLHDPGLRINAEYYITRVIVPPLHRCFSLLGAQVAAWYSELPRKQQLHLPNIEGPREGGRKATISQYFATCGCIACGRVTSRGVCDQCQLQPQQLSVTLASQVLNWDRRVTLVTKICQSCCGRMYEIDCTSLDCPVLYRLCQARKDLRQADYVRSQQQEFLSF